MHVSQLTGLYLHCEKRLEGGLLYNLRKEAPDPTLCLAKAAYWARALARWAACRSMALLERRADAPGGPEPRRADPSVPNASKYSNVNNVLDCKIWRPHSDAAEDASLLGCYTATG